MTKLYFVRHAQTNGNLENRVYGKVDLPINQTGRAQAKTLANELAAVNFDAVFSSPMLRCRQTAELLVGSDVEILADHRLTERDYGTMEGAHFDEIDYQRFWSLQDEKTYNGAEPLAQIRARVEDFATQLCQTYPRKTLLIVTHGSIIRIMRGITTQKFSGNYAELPRTENCGVFIAELC